MLEMVILAPPQIKSRTRCRTHLFNSNSNSNSSSSSKSAPAIKTEWSTPAADSSSRSSIPAFKSSPSLNRNSSPNRPWVCKLFPPAAAARSAPALVKASLIDPVVSISVLVTPVMVKWRQCSPTTTKSAVMIVSPKSSTNLTTAIRTVRWASPAVWVAVAR